MPCRKEATVRWMGVQGEWMGVQGEWMGVQGEWMGVQGEWMGVQGEWMGVQGQWVGVRMCVHVRVWVGVGVELADMSFNGRMHLLMYPSPRLTSTPETSGLFSFPFRAKQCET